MPVRLVGLGTAPAVLSFGGGAYAPEKILVEAPLYMQNVRISHFDGEYSSAGATFGVRGTIVLEDCGVATNCSGSAVNLQAGSRAWFHRTSFESVPDYDYPRYVIEIEGGCFGAARCTFKPPAEEAGFGSRGFLRAFTGDPSDGEDGDGEAGEAGDSEVKKEVVELLLADCRVDVNAKDDAGRTVFIAACQSGNADVVRLLLADLRVDVNAKANNGVTGFIYACRNGHVDVVKLLLGDPRVDLNAAAEMAELNDKTTKTESKLHGPTGFVVACWLGKDEIISLLLANPRVEVNLADTDGTTGVVQLLLERPDRVDVTIRNKAGLSAADVGTPDTKRLVRAKLDEAEAARKQHEARVEKERTEHDRRKAEARAAEAEQARKAELELRMKELQLKERELAVKEKLGASNPPRASPSRISSDKTVVPTTKSPSEGSSSSSRGSTKTAGLESSFVSKLRIAPEDVRYEEKDVLGEGGFGKVYRGVLRGATSVAVKTIKGTVGPRTMRMFLDEIAVWEGLNQRNVLPLLAFCENPPLMVSEFCTDGNLRDRLDDLDWDQNMGLRYLKGVAEGMAYLHSFRVLHGDLKYLNIMIDHDVAKIADFGLSRVRTHLSNSSSMNAGGGSGTPPFMAPEIWDGEKLKAPADVYAFAMVCFEVTSEGMYPFQGMNAMAIMRKVCDERKRPARPDLASDAMWALMQRMWAQDSPDRPAFVEVAAAMAGW
ncbi:kinase-like domain-containing protein [Hyaloraphidium curvatum]|nr:kinase-like domain-containing protein [Hyaloraphidium curvatum]